MTALLKSNPHAQALFESMQAIVEAPGFDGLKRFQNDFYDIDREIIFDSWHPDAAYVWMVRENGTHLALIGATESDFYELDAVIKLEPDALIFHVSSDGVVPIDTQQYKTISQRPADYRVSHSNAGLTGKLYQGTSHIASFKQLSAITRSISVSSEGEPLSLQDIQALRRIAVKEKLYVAQPGFTQSAYVSDVDGIPVGEALDAAYAREVPIELPQRYGIPPIRLKP